MIARRKGKEDALNKCPATVIAGGRDILMTHVRTHVEIRVEILIDRLVKDNFRRLIFLILVNVNPVFK